MKIALDAMGGDFAPKNEVEGAIGYLAQNPKDEVFLVGNKDSITKELNKFPRNSQIQIVHANQVVTMEDSPTAILKSKKDSSMAVGLRLHSKGEVDAFVSTGNTGAQLAFSGAILKRIKGVSRAGIGAFLPNIKGFTFIMDVGANVDCKPEFLYQFAVMSGLMCKHMYNIDKPTVGLLSIGEEDSKGNELTIQTNEALRNSELNFFGNVEGRDVLIGTTDIIICDGFTGNIVLKMAESVSKVFSESLKRSVGKNPISIIGATITKPAFNKMKRFYDYQTYGGVPLLGVNGISIICHGKSTGLAITNALKQAVTMHDSQVNKKIQEVFGQKN